jgi:hypothetical protein
LPFQPRTHCKKKEDPANLLRTSKDQQKGIRINQYPLGSGDCEYFRYIQNWLIDSLPWIGRKELANSSLSTSCETFRQLCWPKLHQKVKPHKIPNLQCTHNRTQFRRLDTNEIIPIASTPAPHYIDGIGTIELR